MSVSQHRAAHSAPGCKMAMPRTRSWLERSMCIKVTCTMLIISGRERIGPGSEKDSALITFGAGTSNQLRQVRWLNVISLRRTSGARHQQEYAWKPLVWTRGFPITAVLHCSPTRLSPLIPLSQHNSHPAYTHLRYRSTSRRNRAVHLVPPHLATPNNLSHPSHQTLSSRSHFP